MGGVFCVGSYLFLLRFMGCLKTWFTIFLGFPKVGQVENSQTQCSYDYPLEWWYSYDLNSLRVSFENQPVFKGIIFE